jgi:hypothetical protein
MKIGKGISVAKCFTGRIWINFFTGMLAIGFGPNAFIERVMVNRKLIYWSRSK